MKLLKTKKRKRILQLIGIAVLFCIIGYNTLFRSQNMIEYRINPSLVCVNPNWKGNVFINGKFQNDTIPESAPLLEVLKWKFSKNPQKKEKKEENYRLTVESIDSFSDTKNKIIWLGHATFLIQLDGARIITDPVFGDIPTKKRKVQLPCNPDSLKNIDYLLVSHDHRDHFDKKSIEQLHLNNPFIQALAPLEAKRLFSTKKLKQIPLQEAGWYQEYNIEKDIRIVFLPAKHWGRRSLNDFNKTLWGSFLIIGKKTKVFFAGDSAYHPHIYKDIYNLFGAIDICIFPIGAYSPEYMMASSHMNPEEAVNAFNDLKGKIFIPMHYGTFDLSDEPLGEPIKRLITAIIENNRANKLTELSIGGTYLIDNLK
ncbi:MBL fold metallo-hydrolase [Apibacter adventoris]|nr:MBL fold metallo-hydrolase [Apibacter adventoris]